MQSNDPDNYKANPDFLLATASHLGVTAVLSDQPSPVVRRVERVLQRIYAEVHAGRIEAPECLEGIGAQLAIVQGQPPTIEELLWAYSASRALRNREQADNYSPIDSAQHSLLDECESINREVWKSCEERIEKARHALSALDQATVRVADLGGIVDRRALPSGRRIFISYAHEDKSIAQFIEQPQSYDLVRFARTSEVHSNNSAFAAYSDEFYGFTNSYIGGTVLLEGMANLIEELLASIPRGKENGA